MQQAHDMHWALQQYAQYATQQPDQVQQLLQQGLQFTDLLQQGLGQSHTSIRPGPSR